MKKRILRILAILTIVLIQCLVLFPTPALALADPDDLSIDYIKVFQDQFEDGDWLIIAQYSCVYAAEPAEGADETFLFSLYDGATLIKSRTLNYYGHNLISLWITPSQAAALTWGTGYTVKIIGNPVHFATPPSAVASLASNYIPNVDGDYTPAEDVLAAGDFIIARAEALETYLGALTTYVSGRTLLTTTGASIVEEAIPGAQAIYDIYQYSSTNPNFEREDYTRDYQYTMSGEMILSQCEVTTNWAAGAGVDLSLFGDRKEGLKSIQAAIESPVAGNWYTASYTFPGALDLSSSNYLTFYFKDSIAFSGYRVRITDGSANWGEWQFDPDQTAVWEQFRFEYGDYDFDGGVDPDLTDVASVTIRVQASSGVDCAFLIDELKVINTMSIGATVQRGVYGVADWLHIPPHIFGMMFFLTIYAIAGSVVLLSTNNPSAALVIPLPIFIVAGPIMGVVDITMSFVVVFVLAMVAFYYAWVQ